jgi:hypothetical protein
VYGLDTTRSFDFLNQALLTQVCVGQNELILRFDGDIVLRVESELRVLIAQRDERFVDPIEASRAIVSFLGHEVTAARAPSRGSLELHFGPSMLIEVFDSSANYESFSLEWPGGAIIV